jgi:hypothetical protein
MSSAPNLSLLDRLLDPVTQALSPEAARRLVDLRADDVAQERIDLLADKCTEGTLSPDERAEYESLVHAANLIAILQSKARAMLSRNPAA